MDNRKFSSFAGFSLIEVLVAVVVLSFGLLALAALQGSLFKASAEARMQSAALALATEKLEFFRGYSGTDEYLAIDSEATAETVAVGGIDYSREWEVNRYAAPVDGGEFESVGNTTAALGTGYNVDNEFKHVAVTVKWKDASGKDQYLTVEDAIAAIDPGDSRKIAKSAGSARPRGPAVRIYQVTSQQDGVIPIAIGDGTETAATNPKPIVNGSNVIETRFDILTYSGDGATAVSQSRIQTNVVACQCDYGNKPADNSVRGKRPTFWDGTRYVVPENTDYVPPAGVSTAASSTQSSACTICCRDHHDPSTLAETAAKFDPRNLDHKLGHYLLNTSSAALTGPFDSGVYTEVCRVIRVGGFFRVAADSYNDYMNLLDTNSLVTAPDAGKPLYVPNSVPTSNYQNFVKAYLKKRVVDQTSETAYNDVLATDIPITSELETASGINDVADTISVQKTKIFKKSDPAKWLHLRGLYVDYLEPAARQAVTSAKTNCPDSSQVENCVLRVLPFTSINLTELGIWTPRTADNAAIVVASNNYNTTLTSVEPIRGKVSRVGNPATDITLDGKAAMRWSNSGLTTLVNGINPIDAATTAPSTWNATQPFLIQGGEPTQGEVFKVRMGGAYTFANVNRLYVNTSPGAVCNSTPVTTPDADTTLGPPPNPYACSSDTLGVPHSLTVGNYNYQLPDGTSKADLVGCTGSSGLLTYQPKGQESYPVKVCRNYAVTGVTVNGVALAGTFPPAGVDGRLAESTTISVGSISNAAKISVTFGSPVDTAQTPVCTYVNGSGSNKDFTVSVPDCP